MTTVEDRPVIHGLPVPYVASWTDEHWNRLGTDRVSLIKVAGTSHMITYADEQDYDRDDHGALWIRNGLGGGGEPEFGQINAPRYRACIDRVKCQVCGSKVSRTETPWVLPENEWVGRFDHPDVSEFLTTNPPTCQDCWTTALKMCPHLRKGAHTLIVTKWHKWGVLGDVYAFVDGTNVTMPEGLMMVPYGNLDVINRTIAKQSLIALDEWIEVP